MQSSTKDSIQSINQPITLSDKDWKTFYENLVNPPEPTPSLKQAFQEYYKLKKKNV